MTPALIAAHWLVALAIVGLLVAIVRPHLFHACGGADGSACYSTVTPALGATTRVGSPSNQGIGGGLIQQERAIGHGEQIGWRV